MVAERARHDDIRPSIGWVRDLLAEDYLENQVGVNWQYVNGVEMALVDREKSYHNNAREHSLDQELVEDYADMMRGGRAFPATVLFWEPDGTYVIAGGNHRLEAATRAGRVTMDAYVLRVSDQALRDVIVINLNALVGARPSRENRVAKAIRWQQTHGRTITATSDYFGIPESTLADALRLLDIDMRLRRVGHKPDRFSKTVKRRMQPIRLDSVLKATADLEHAAQLPEREFATIVTDVREQTSEPGQLAIVQQYRDRDEIQQRIRARRTGAPPPRRSEGQIRATLRTALTTAERVIRRHPSRSLLQLSQDSDYQAAVAGAERVYSLLVDLP